MIAAHPELLRELRRLRDENEWLWWLVRSDMGMDPDTPPPTVAVPSQTSPDLRAA